MAVTCAMSYATNIAYEQVLFTNQFRCMKIVDYESLYNDLNAVHRSILLEASCDVNEMVTIFENNFLLTRNKYAPCYHRRFRHCRKPWMDDDVTALSHRRVIVHKQYLRKKINADSLP